MNKKRLRIVLEEALKSAPPHNAPRHFTHMWTHDAYSGSARADNRAISLLEALRSETELKIFDGTMVHVVPIAAQTIEYWHLAAWLVRRAQSVGSTQALKDLSRYLKASEIPCEVTVVFSGLEPERPHNMGRGISFVSWADLRNSLQKQSTHERFTMGSPLNHPTGALVRKHNLKKVYISQNEFQKHLEKNAAISGDVDELYDCLMCLSLVGPHAPQAVASWIGVPEWTPLVVGSSTVHGLEGFSAVHRISTAGCNQGRKLFTAFCAISDPTRARLRLVMQRLIRAVRRVTPVDAAIDLGISLEALYLSDMADDRGELSFRLRTRAARLLAHKESERKKMFTLIGDIYSIRSSAVHTGTVAANFRGKPTQEVLQQGFSLTAKTVRRFIASGEPRWDKVMFG